MQRQSSQEEQAAIEKEQEATLKAKFGGLKPKHPLMPKDHKFFDSADWALAKEGKKAPGDDPTSLPVKGPLAAVQRKLSGEAPHSGLRG